MKIAFVGTGIIGSGLAVNAAMRGMDVAMFYRRNPEQLKDRVKGIFDVYVSNGAFTVREAEECFDRIAFSMDLAEVVSGAALVQESIAERVDDKRAMYRKIQEICGEDVIIASSTSGIFPSVLSEGALYPGKIIVGHPYNPSYLLPLVEVCGPQAPQEVIDKAVEIYKAMGKEPVVCRKETEGFIVNKLSWAAMAAAKEAVMNGVCSVEDMVKAIMVGPGM